MKNNIKKTIKKIIPARLLPISRVVSRNLFGQSVAVGKLPVDDRNQFLNQISGVIHVGANVGQEKYLYASLGLGVVWIEPIPKVFRELKRNIAGLKGQVAIQALITNHDQEEYQFHIANNNGASSSILDLKFHKDIWPNVKYDNTISLKSTTLTTLARKKKLKLEKYQALIMDTQGSELLVLKGCIPILEHFTYIKTEVADFESYEGCCQLSDIESFMTKYGYTEVSRNKFASRTTGGNYFDVVYKKKA